MNRILYDYTIKQHKHDGGILKCGMLKIDSELSKLFSDIVNPT